MTDDARCLPGGTIDFDFYRAQGIALRRQAMRNAGLRLTSAATSVMAAAPGFAVVISSGTGHAGEPVDAFRIAPFQRR